MSPAGRTIPVIGLTGYLGAGKTSLLNHLLRQPFARIGVVINDFGEVNIDAGLVTGQIDDPAAISGGCICCLTDAGGLDEALARLAAPRLALDAIIVEASGLADPVALARIIKFSNVRQIRAGGVVDVVDAAEHFRTVDIGPVVPQRYGVTSLVVVNKLDLVPDPDAVLARVTERVHQRNPQALVVAATRGQIDPTLLYDVSATDDEQDGQLSLRSLLLETDAPQGHRHADSVTVSTDGGVDPDRLIELLEEPPAGVYRLKGTAVIRQAGVERGYLINLAGAAVHVAPAGRSVANNTLVAIGPNLDLPAVRCRLQSALTPQEGSASTSAVKGWQRLCRLSS